MTSLHFKGDNMNIYTVIFDFLHHERPKNVQSIKYHVDYDYKKDSPINYNIITLEIYFFNAVEGDDDSYVMDLCIDDIKNGSWLRHLRNAYDEINHLSISDLERIEMLRNDYAEED